MSDDIERLAIHEAGHTVAAVALGLEVYTVQISPATVCLLSRVATLEPPAGLRWQLAGIAAESLAFGTVHEEGAMSDRVKANREAFTITRDLDATKALVTATWPEVRDMLFDQWRNVERVALALLRSDALSGAELERLVIA